MRILRVNFVDFWPNFAKQDNYFYNLLKTGYDVEVDEENPDLVFFSVDYSKSRQRDKYLNHPCKKIFYTGENVRPNLDFPGSIEYPNYSIGKSDFAFTFDHSEHPCQYRLPLWVLFINWFDVPYSETRDPSYLISPNQLLERRNFSKERFCNFVFSNPSSERLNILEHVSRYKPVDCAGSLKNNVGYRIKGRGDQKPKVDFLKKYKFTIAAENSSHPGYTTEKIIHPFSVGSIPIYWGSDTVGEHFNESAFINIKKYDSLTTVAELIKEIDNDADLYESYLQEPVFKNNQIPSRFLPHNVLRYIEEEILC